MYSVHEDVNPTWSPGVWLPHVIEDCEVWSRVHRAARPWFPWPGTAMAAAGPLFVLWGVLASAPGGAGAVILGLCAFMTVVALIAMAVGLGADTGDERARRNAVEEHGGGGPTEAGRRHP